MTRQPPIVIPDRIRIEGRHFRVEDLVKAAFGMPGHFDHPGIASMPPSHYSQPVTPPAVTHVPKGPDSQTLHSNQGTYTPERQAMHEQIYHHYISGAGHGENQDLHKLYGDYAADKPRKIAVMMAGGSGSGKSTYARKKFMKHPRFEHIDADEIKAHLANAEGRPGNDKVDPGHYHEESSDVSKKLQHRYHEHGKSYVFDGTGADAESLGKKMRAAKDAGYEVALHHVHAPLATAMKWNSGRARKVDENVLREKHAGVRESVLKNRHLADRFRSVMVDEEHRSPFAARRSEILGKRNALQKSEEVATMEKSAGGMKKFTLKPGHVIVGHVDGGHLHVHDIIHNTSSERVMTGHRPDLKPIPLEDLHKRFPHLTIDEHRPD